MEIHKLQNARIEVPAEWSPQQAMWTAWPSHPDLWVENLMPARREVAAMIMALASAGRVNVLAMGDKALAAAKTALVSPNVKIIPANFGDIWLRDTGPIFVRANGKKAAATFRFNGWGGKYDLPHDGEVAGFIAKQAGVTAIENDFILEGGALEHDGAGTILTTRQCLLNPNRNTGNFNRNDIEEKVKAAFGAQRILWLDKGLLNDHTDGHVDNIARFAAPGHVICQSPSGADDPNADVLNSIAEHLSGMGMKVTRIPSPGLIVDDEEGEPVAASHMNYIIYNGVIVLPTYEDVYSKEAAKALQAVFPSHRIVPVSALHVLTGGGSFHCITQQEF